MSMTTTKLTSAVCLALTVLIAGTGMSSALSRIDGPKIDLPKDNTPIDMRNNTPIDIEDPFGGVNDAVLNGRGPGAATALLVGCVVDGVDLVLINNGDAIPAGAKVKWAAGLEHGGVQLPNGLNASQKAVIENVLAGDAGKCAAEVSI